MNEKITIGELAKDAGITTKAIRIYEQKGLLTPIAYSEGNYRLYDENAKVRLQQILTLKFIGFSLSDIGELIEQETEGDLVKSLLFQKNMLERKKAQIEKVIYCVDKAVNKCKAGEADWQSFTDIMQAIVLDRNADEGHWTALKYGTRKDWYEQIYDSL